MTVGNIWTPVRAAASLALAVLFAACSASQNSQSLPLGASHALQAHAAAGSLLQMQLAGQREAPVPLGALRRAMQVGMRPQLAFHAGAPVAIWAADTNFNYVLGQDASGLNTLTAIDVSKNNCYSPVALKVDARQNLWVGCELTSQSGTNGAVQEYSAAGALLNQYLPACPRPVSQCASFSGYGFDSGLDAHGHVFASLNLYSIEICNPNCTTSLSAGFEWWPKSKPSAVPVLISTGTSCSPICGVGYMDVDAAGNLWFTFSGYDSNNNYGFGLGEITSPTTSPALTIVEPIGTYGFFGGVYASNHGHTLNVIDQKARTISQYHLPLAQNGAPFNVLGPTLLNAFGIGDPVSGAFNATDSKIAIGDSGGWLDLGKRTGNSWTAIASPNFYSGLNGAAYSPSDK